MRRQREFGVALRGERESGAGFPREIGMALKSPEDVEVALGLFERRCRVLGAASSFRIGWAPGDTLTLVLSLVLEGEETKGSCTADSQVNGLSTLGDLRAK